MTVTRLTCSQTGEENRLVTWGPSTGTRTENWTRRGRGGSVRFGSTADQPFETRRTAAHRVTCSVNLLRFWKSEQTESGTASLLKWSCILIFLSRWKQRERRAASRLQPLQHFRVQRHACAASCRLPPFPGKWRRKLGSFLLLLLLNVELRNLFRI